MANYYNEIDPFAAAWLRELIRRNLIAEGEVDERSIADVRLDDLRGFTQHHFFAGIGGWPYALRLAGWPNDRPVWTGSCPCQPFSAAGKQKGFDDPRHLWPEFHRLIREYRPHVVFGEQVASAMQWLDLVSGDLEGEGYAVGSAIVGAHSVGAPHIRQRIYWVGQSSVEQVGISRQPREQGSADGMEYATRNGWLERGAESGERSIISSGELGDDDDARSQGRSVSGADREWNGSGELVVGQASAWSECDWLPCIDGKSRPVEPGTFPLAHGLPGRVGRLRGYGNAIVPQVAAAFVESYMKAVTELR